MNNLRNQIANNTLIRYILTGGTSFLIELGCLLILMELGLGALVAVGISFWIGLATAFILQKIFAFKDTERRYKHIAWQMGVYSALVLINYLFTLVFVALTEPLLGIIISRTIALVITTCWNYVLYRYVIFNPKGINNIRLYFKRNIR